MLGRVRKCFSDDVIRGHFSGLGQPSVDRDIEFDGHRGAAGHRLECWGKSSLDRIAGWMPREISCRSCETPVNPVTMSEICSRSGCKSAGTDVSAAPSALLSAAET
jgi:hypothetical protein